MKTVQIYLNSIDKVKSFVNDITKFEYDFDLVSGRYVVDAKSIMGIFILDLSNASVGACLSNREFLFGHFIECWWDWDWKVLSLTIC